MEASVIGDMNTPKGVLPILHTPFNDRDEIDERILKRQIDWAFELGADGCCTGMVSELIRLTTDERLHLTQLLPALIKDRGTFVMSVGAESTKQAVFWTVEADKADCSAVMAIPPTTTALSDSGLIDYFSAIARATDRPLIVQDASGYVGKTIPLSVQIALLKQFGASKILFKPESSPIGPNISLLRDASNRRARMFDGSGGVLLVDCHRRGVVGTMPGMDLLDGIIALWNALQSEKMKLAYEIYFPICAIVTLQMQAGLDGFLAIEKHLMVKRGIFRSVRRRKPYLWELDSETQLEIDRLFSILQKTLRS